MRSYSASSSLPFKQNTSQPETDPLTNLKWRGKSFLSSQPETDPLTVVSELLNPFSRDGMLKKEYFVSENANCPSDVVCVSFMYGPRLVEFAHSRKEMHSLSLTIVATNELHDFNHVWGCNYEKDLHL